MSQPALFPAPAADRTCAELLRQNEVTARFFARETPRLAAACRAMAARFSAGGRLLAFGNGAAASDAAHVAVEFVHPVIVGKRALPAVDLGREFAARLPVVLRPHDMALGLAHAGPDAAVERALAEARERGALTLGMAAAAAEHAFEPPDADPFAAQEVFETAYHVLWETVHLFFEHRAAGPDAGAAAFLYPFLGAGAPESADVTAAAAASMGEKAAEVNRLRAAAAETECAPLATAARAVRERLERGGRLLLFGNGGSATDAGDLETDCLAPPPGMAPLPALSLAADPACLTAIANDVGAGALLARQLMAHARPEDALLAITASGGSANILAGLEEARRRGLLTVALAGYDGGRIAAEGLAEHVLVVRSEHIPRIQEVQASLYHALRRRLAEPEPGRDAPA